MSRASILFLAVCTVVIFSGCKPKSPPDTPLPVDVRHPSLEEEETREIFLEDAWAFSQRGMENFIAGDLDAAIENFEIATRISADRSQYWKYLGDVYFMQGRYHKAIEQYDQAIFLNRDYGIEEPEVFEKRGQAYYFIGNYFAAIDDFDEAILLNEYESRTWDFLGLAYRGKGDYDRAIFNFKKAIDLDRENVNALNNLGLAYLNNGDYDDAIANFSRVIDIDKLHSQAWNNRGCAWLEKGEADKAISDFNQVLGFNSEYADAYSNRSRAYIDKKEFQKALDDCNRALAIDPNSTPALNNRARAYLEMGDFKKALAAYEECLDKSAQSINVNDSAVYSWYLAAQVYNNYPYLKGDVFNHDFWSGFTKPIVLDGIGKGIEYAENLRQNMGIQGSGVMTQMIYLYYAGVDFEINFGSREQAFYYSESLRSRGFLEQVGTEAAIRLDGICESERRRFKELRAIIDEQQAIINSYEGGKPGGEANDKLVAARNNLRSAKESLAELDAILSQRVDKYAGLRNPKPITLDQAKEYCGDDRVVLEYVLWDTAAYNPIRGYESWDMKGSTPTINSYCLVITKDGVTPVRLPLDDGFDCSKTIDELRTYIRVSPAMYEKPRNDLYDRLIKPVLPYIGNIKNVTIVPDGELALIPFDILRENSGAKDLGQLYAISLSPSLSVSMLARKNVDLPASSILFFANNEYKEKKYHDGQLWPDLGGVEEEIGKLTALANGLNINYRTVFGESATKEKLSDLSINAELKKYPIIHFACHGQFNKENPTESGLVLYLLSDDGTPANRLDGYLTIPEIAVLDLNAKMVILSACETGISEARLGEGMVGLVRAFMVAGASNVGVSLWKIDDSAASSFMERLYNKALVEEKHFREGYKEVKEVFRVDNPLQRWPYYWAAFTMYE